LHGRRGFVLFEAMLATVIFALAVLSLGRCVDNCLRADILMQEDERARRALENRMNEIEAGAVAITEPLTDELKGAFEGMTLKQSREELKRKNEKEQEISGLFKITLELSWSSHNEPRSRSLQFYVYPHQR
jgi:type II secretory pathway component PulJ